MTVAEKVELRCPTPKCDRLLLKVSEVTDIEIETKCPKCKTTVTARLVEQTGEDT